MKKVLKSIITIGLLLTSFVGVSAPLCTVGSVVGVYSYQDFNKVGWIQVGRNSYKLTSTSGISSGSVKRLSGCMFEFTPFKVEKDEEKEHSSKSFKVLFSNVNSISHRPNTASFAGGSMSSRISR